MANNTMRERGKQGRTAQCTHDHGVRGQVTLFIILAVLIVVLILVFFIFLRPSSVTAVSPGFSFEQCVRDSIETSIAGLSRNAGFIQPEFTFPYQGEQYAYLCYTNEYYETCTVQKAFLKQHFEDQLEKKTKGRVNTCYTNSVEDLKDQGYGVRDGTVNYELSLEPNSVIVKLEAPTTIGSQSFKNFNFKMDSPIYEMVMLATSLVQSEAAFGDASTTELMLYYPEYIVDKQKQGEGTTLYVVEHKLFNYKFQFASRSLVFPAGYLYE